MTEQEELKMLRALVEKKIKELSYEEKKDKRQVASRAALDAFWSWCEETKNIPTTNEKLTKALNYAMNHRVQLEVFLLDGRLEISNNLCESHIYAHLPQEESHGCLQILLKVQLQVLLLIH